MELPSINSTTSISDNAELRNYYDKLLFRNNSGRSLADLQAAGNAAAVANHKAGDQGGNAGPAPATAPVPRVDFINGFGASSPSSAGGSFSGASGPPRRQSIFNSLMAPEALTTSSQQDSLSFSFAMPGFQNRNGSIPQEPLRPTQFLGDYSGERRASYIADTLIRQNVPQQGPVLPVQNNNDKAAAPGTQYNYLNYLNGQVSHQQQPQQIQQPSPPLPQIQPQQQQQQPQMRQYNEGYYRRNRQNQNQNNMKEANGRDEQNGIILNQDRLLQSSDDLHALYLDCGKNYFSAKEVYHFADYVKAMLQPQDQSIGDFTPDIRPALSQFLAFLKSCNLNYNPQSDAFMSSDKRTATLRRNSVPIHSAMATAQAANKLAALQMQPSNSNSNSTSAYLHYRPLVLVSLKNGKLELLSMAQSAQMAMKRGDLVVIDGDRGKDLTLVVEPVVSLNLALIINFLKKKIHFDSLITNKNQHFPNGSFIEALQECTRGVSDKLNPKLYDIIELTQLVVPSKQVLRFATPWEVGTNLHNKFQDELKALHIAQLKLKALNSGLVSRNGETDGQSANNQASTNGNNNGKRLNIKILNAEFQFDRKKLTFYYICEERNDFRELIKELFKFYKTRIWLCAIPNNLDIDTQYYDKDQKELKMYQEMMQHYSVDDLVDSNIQQNGGNNGFIVAPPLNELELDNFQIGVYQELVKQLF